ncbi:MAG: phosphatidylserine/phosphatidylglycerophosphate/cardiolipin synthase family protein [Gemmataceae bacterium]|nr:phosphatidylserine/phosphatidylglycerophosphate/cardiolipin synthase family protein [Gemmataceae bacterium]
MRKPGKRKVRDALTLFRRYFGRCLLCVLTGCRSPAVPYTAQPGCRALPRKVVVAQQLAEDTAVALANRPLATGWSVVSETADHLRAFAEGDLGKRLVLPLQGPPGPISPCVEPLDLAALESDLHGLTGQDLHPAHVHLYIEGQEALTALEDLVTRATRQIDVIMFQWESDPLGEAIAACLTARAGPNLRVRVLIDGGGNLFFGEPDEACASQVNGVITRLARHPHLEVVRIRNPLARYDHRKLVLVDGCVAWTGGRNFSHPAFFEHHDLSFVFEGPLVPRLQEHFEEYWRTQNGPSCGAVHHALAEATRDRPARLGTPVDTPPVRLSPPALAHAPPPGTVPSAPAETLPEPADRAQCRTPNTWARLLYSEPCNRQIAQALYRAVDMARHRVYVQNVYLTDSRLVYKLAQARRRGVDVRVVLTVHSTTEMINRNNRVVANRLFAAGVRVYLYPSMTHVKAVTVDGCWAYIGTGNLDALSLRHNYELGLSVTGCPLIAQLEERLFLPDFRPEWEMTRPLSTSPLDHLAELIASWWL